MAWSVRGRSVELCNCRVMCPCWLGPDTEPDQGWCGGAFAFDIEEGSADGVELNGRRAVLVAEWPGNFFLGGGTARVYVDDDATSEQQGALGEIFSGRRGGHLEALFSAVVTRWLPAEPAKIDIEWGDRPKVTLGSVGEATLEPIKDPTGRPTKVEGAAALTGFQIESMNLASSKGSHFADPDLRPWDGDSGTLHAFAWSA